MGDGKFDSAWVKSYVDSVYRGNTLRFFPLSFEDTVAFFVIWEGSPTDIMSKNREKLQEFVAKSLRCEKKDIEESSPGFLLFAMENLLKSIDLDFFVAASRNLNEQMQTLVEKIDKVSSQASSDVSQEKKDGVQVTS